MSDKQNESYIIREKYKTNEKLKHYMYAGQWIIFSLIGLFVFIFNKEFILDKGKIKFLIL